MIHSKFYNHLHSQPYQYYKCGLIQAFLSKCWTIQTPIWEPWGASVNCTSKSSLSDPYLQRQSHNNGGPNQQVPNHGCQWDKWTPVLCSIQSPKGVTIKLQGSFLHPDPLGLLQQCMSTPHNHHKSRSKWHLSPYYAQTVKVRFLILWTLSHLDLCKQLWGHMKRHVNY